MHKKLLLKFALLLPTLPLLAVNKTRALFLSARTFSSVQQARYITPLLQAIAQNNTEGAKALLAQGNQDLFTLHPDSGHSLSFIALQNNNIDLLKLLHTHGARLLSTEQEICCAWETRYPGLFEPIIPEFCQAI